MAIRSAENAAAINMARNQQSVIEKMVIVRVMQILPAKIVIVVLPDIMIFRTANPVRVWLLVLKE